MNVIIPNDYQDAVRCLECFAKLANHSVTIFTDTVKETDALAERLQSADVLVLIRERTRINEALQRVNLPPLGMTQLSRIASAMGLSSAVTEGRLILSSATPGAAVAAYASIIDNVTNDPRTLLPQSGPYEPPI